MEDGDGYLFSEDSLSRKCEKSSKQVFQSLRTKHEEPKSQEESTTEEEHHKLSNCYNNIAKNVCSKESNDLKVKLNGDVGSAIDTSERGNLVISEESSKSKTKGDKTCSDINVVDKVYDEQASLEVFVRKRKTCGSPDSSSAQHDSLVSESVHNASFKKRKISRASIPTQSVIPQAEAHLSKPISEDSPSSQKSPSTPTEAQSSAVPDPVEPDTHLTGFAQYLGLQPIVKFRCFKCEETGFPSLLKLQEHQNACLKNLKVPLIPKPSQPHVSMDPSLSSTNFRISRKVFLCGSCGTYYENWNLFLHMREVHKRLICLYCLTMFSQIDMLSAHLTAKHGIVETVHSSPEDLLSDCKGSCFLMCCDCDAIFTERDDFSNHVCTEKPSANTCQCCGLRGTHLSACPRAVTSTNTITTAASCSFSQTDPGSTITDSNKHSPQMTTHERGSASVTKYLIPVSSVQVPYKKTILKKPHLLENQEHSNELSDVDDDYDISNAASYCHVNIHEPLEKLTPVPEKTSTQIIKTSDTPPPSIANHSTQVLTSTKSTSLSNKLTTNTVLSTVDSLHEDSCSIEHGKIEPIDKVILNHDKPQSVSDSLMLNKLLEPKREPGTCIDEDTNYSKHLRRTEESIAPQQYSETEENTSIAQTISAPKTCISPPPLTTGTEMDTESVSTPEKHFTHSSPSKSQAPLTPTLLETELVCTSTSSLTIGMVESKMSAPTDMIDVDTLTSANVNDGKSPEYADAIEVKSPPRTDVTDIKSPAGSEITDVKSPASASSDTTDVESPASPDMLNVASPASPDMLNVESRASPDMLNVASPASLDEIDNKSSNSDLIDVKSSTSMDTIYSKLPARTGATGYQSPTRRDLTSSKALTRTSTTDSRSPARIDVTGSKSPARADEMDVKSPASADEMDVKSPASADEMDVTSPASADEMDVKSPASADGVVLSPAREDEIQVKSPADGGEIEVKSPESADGFDKSPAREDEIQAKSPADGDEIDVKSPVRGDDIDGKSSTKEDIDVKSPPSTDMADVKLPEQLDVANSKSPAITDVVASKSPTRTEWNDYQYSKSPFIAELEDSSTSSLRIELNNSSESTTSKEFSKSPLEFSDSKSPLSLSGDLNNSSRTSPTAGLKCSLTSPLPESSKSPRRTSVLNDSSRTSSRASSVDDILKSPSSVECQNNTQNSTDTNGSSPLTVSEPTANLQPAFTKTYSSESPTLVDGCKAGSENRTKSKSDLGIKLQISSNGTHVIIPKTALNIGAPSKRRRKGKSRSSPKKAMLAANVDTMAEGENDMLTLTDFGNNEEKEDENNKIYVNVKSKKKKAAKEARRLNKKISRTSKIDAESFSGSENNIVEDSTSKVEDISDYIQLAGDEVAAMELHLEDDLEALTIQVVLQESVKTSYPTCVYCNHAKKIAVNGKQLALHLLAEHKFLPVYSKCENTSDMSYLSADEFPSRRLQPSGELSTQVPAIEETEISPVKNKVLMDQYVNKLKMSLPNLQELFLNTDTYDSSDRTFSHPYDRTYECFHCNFLTVLHKELYVHNRKMHQKTILLCIMCKSNFYSYSELLCHLCPGIYVPESNIKFRCHICSLDSLPSTFRLMVHLRKRHFVCDVCLETTEDQQKLSTHVWKHKLHHLCYRCGIAYRNKPDITKHLFWKHGTESVLCKKCLQKKWPHVYHFCIPPNAFVCEECNASFTRAVALKVHKRLHTGDLLHGCDECEEHFISKRLLIKHQDKHREVTEPKVEEPSIAPEPTVTNVIKEEPKEHETAIEHSTSSRDHLSNHLESVVAVDVETPVEETTPITYAAVVPPHHTKKVKKVDVYDLPPLNLSSDSDDSDGEQDIKTRTTILSESLDISNPASTKSENVVTQAEEDTQQPVTVVDGIWDNFQNYKANLERRESQSSENVVSTIPTLPTTAVCANVLTHVMLDHDYCVAEDDAHAEETPDQVPSTSGSVPYALEQRVALSDIGEKIDDKNNSFDHDYCFNKGVTEVPVVKEEECKEKSETIAHSVDSSCANPNASIKKQKSQKKKKRSASSSSSDSSSSSGSSSCSCGENCSCSSSSSSSGSSSDSSDSDKSTSESRRRQIARKERREKVRRKKEEEASARETLSTPSAQCVDEVNQPCVPSEPEEKEVPILESDLDTDETETDEDFYDQHPQLLANKLMAEKRNQLLLLAAVAPINNITPQPESVIPSTSEVSPQRKKVKSKKRKKRQHDAEKSSENKLKLSLSTNYYNYQTSNTDFYKPVSESHSFNPMHNFSQSSRLPPAPSIRNSVEPVSSAAESGSETDSKRLSKRRRLPKKFYGDSSDEDSSSHTKRSRKPQPAVISTPLTCPPLTPPPVYRSLNPPPEPARVQPLALAISEPEKSEEEDGAETESEQGDVKKSSSESSSESEGEKEMEIHTDSDAEPPLVVETAPVQPPPQVVKKNENLYCYCQCPYDEVSEMIACDGKDCTIEWFHFECVGIMVPPKGKWFCPDCKKSVPTKNPYFS